MAKEIEMKKNVYFPFNRNEVTAFSLEWLKFIFFIVVLAYSPTWKSETALRSQLVRPKDAVDPAKQDGVVYRISCECGKVYIGETGRPIQDRIKQHDRDIRLARTETFAVLERAHNTGHEPLWNDVKFIDRDPYYYTHRVKEPIHIRLHPNKKKNS